MAAAADSFRQEDYVRSAALYSAVIDSQPDNALAYSNRAASFLKTCQFEKALSDARRCTQLDPSFAKGWGRLGSALAELKHYSDSAVAYAKAAQLDPGNQVYKEQCAEMQKLVSSGRGIASDGDREEYYFRRSVEQGTAAMKAGSYADAIRHFTKAISQINKSKNELHVLLANRSSAHLKSGATLEAIDDAVEAVKISPNYARGHVRLAAAYLAREQTEEARQCLVVAETLDPRAATLPELKAEVVRLEKQQTERAQLQAQTAKALRDDLARAHASSTQVDQTGAVQRSPAAVPVATVAGPAAPKHTVSYSYCRVCSEYGHVARDCPMKLKKR
jgi:tetratricopeptide (TPR) repeat protein